MEIKEILELINAIDKSTLSKFSYNEGNVSIEIEKQLDTINKNNVRRNEIENIEIEDSSKLNEQVNMKSIKSPLVGTYYSSPSPNDKQFISVGDRISKNQVIGIIEVMKMMNEIKSDVDGIVEEILVENNETVEYEQEIVKIKLL